MHPTLNGLPMKCPMYSGCRGEFRRVKQKPCGSILNSLEAFLERFSCPQIQHIGIVQSGNHQGLAYHCLCSSGRQYTIFLSPFRMLKQMATTSWIWWLIVSLSSHIPKFFTTSTGLGLPKDQGHSWESQGIEGFPTNKTADLLSFTLFFRPLQHRAMGQTTSSIG